MEMMERRIMDERCAAIIIHKEQLMKRGARGRGFVWTRLGNYQGELFGIGRQGGGERILKGNWAVEEAGLVWSGMKTLGGNSESNKKRCCGGSDEDGRGCSVMIRGTGGAVEVMGAMAKTVEKSNRGRGGRRGERAEGQELERTFGEMM
ncbi:unnamed protein product [Calypogeia fissa]